MNNLLTRILFLFFCMSIVLYTSYGKVGNAKATHPPFYNDQLSAEDPNQHPLAFLKNIGQLTDENNNRRKDIDFKLKVNDNLIVFVSAQGIYYQWMKPLSDSLCKDCTPGVDIFQMGLELLNANVDVEPEAGEMQDYYERYYVSDLPGGSVAYSYNKIVYRNVYPHIDWVLYTKDNKLKYDFVVHRGGNVADIKLKYRNHSSIELEDGKLNVFSDVGSISEDKPYSYDPSTKQEIRSAYVLRDSIVSFATDEYTDELIIDPTIVWSTYYGGLVADEGRAIAKKGANGLFDYVFVAGRTNSWQNIVIHPFLSRHKILPNGMMNDGNFDGFIAAYSPNGRHQWATYFGGGGHDVINGIVYGKSGYLYIAGSTKSDTGIATSGSHRSIAPGSIHTLDGWYRDGFIAKFDTTGQLVWGTYYGGERRDEINGLSLDAVENIYIAGSTDSDTGISTAGTFKPNFSGGDIDAFIAKFNSNGQFIWGTYFGDDRLDEANAVLPDNRGSIYVAGSTKDDTCGNADPNKRYLIASPGAYQVEPANVIYPGCPHITTAGVVPLYDGFFAKFDANTGMRLWGTYLGGVSNDYAHSIAFDSTRFIDEFGKWVDGIAYVGCSSLLAAFKTDGKLYWNRSGAGAGRLNMTFNKNGLLVAGGGIFYQGARIAPGIGGALVTDDVTDDNGYHIYATGVTTAKTGIAVGPYIEQPEIGDEVGTLYGDAYIMKLYSNEALTFHPRDKNPIVPPRPFAQHPLTSISPKHFGNFCTGVEYDVAYSISAPVLGSPADLIVQLSDSSGSFEDYTNIASGTGPIISFTFPNNIPAGHNYKMRMISRNPLIISGEVNVRVISSPNPVITSKNNYCLGDTIRLETSDTIDNSTIIRQWVNLDSSMIHIGKDLVIPNANFNHSSRYIFTTITEFLCDNHDTINILVKPNPVITAVTNNSPVCEGKELHLAVMADTVGGASFNWSGPGFSSSDQTPVLTNPSVANKGKFYVTITKYGCTSSDSTLVDIDTMPAMPVAVANGPLCYGDTIKLDAASATPGVSYLWKGPGNFSSTLASPQLLKSTDGNSGNYTVSATLDKCTSAEDTVTVIVKEQLSAPDVSSNSPVKAGSELKLFAAGINGAIYQWTGPDSFNSNEQNPILKNVPYTATGNYHVTANVDGCMSSATTVVIVNTTSEVYFVMFPNPNNGVFTIKATMSNEQVVPIEVANSVGQTVYEERFTSKKRLLLETVTLPGYLPAGTYYLRIRIDQSYKVVPFTIHK
jgi:hypothetical protein